MYAFTENIMDTRLTPRQRIPRAFTLIELLVVIAIIAILAAILFPAFGAVREQARQSGTISNMHAVYVGAKLFNEDEGRYPSVLFGYAEVADNTLAAMTPPRPPQRPAMSGDLATPMDRAKELFSTFTGTTQEGLNRGYLYPEQVKDYVTFTCPDNLIKDKQAKTQVYYPLNSPYNPGGLVVWDAPGTPDANGCSLVGDRDIPNINYINQPKLYYVMDSMDIGPALDANGNIVYNPDHTLKYESWTTEMDNPALKGKKFSLKSVFIGIDKVDGKEYWKVKQTSTVEVDAAGAKTAFEMTHWMEIGTGETFKAEGSVKDLPTQFGPVNWTMKIEKLKAEKPKEDKKP